jgi:DUF971 family protein
MRVELAHSAVVGGELALVWGDGAESYLPLGLLRRNCPCASCQGEPDALGRVVRPLVEPGPRGTELRGWEEVGGYALRLHWGDGHSSGIYSFSYLRGLSKEGGN